MSRVLCLFALACLTFNVGLARAFDYSKIHRVLGKEPAYQTKHPLYALLVFGPEAKFRVWVVLDGTDFYLDRNGDGDLTGKDEKFKNLEACQNIELAGPDGRTRYLVTNVNTFINASKTFLNVDLDIKGPLKYQQYSGGQMNEDPKKASISHFDGPLTATPQQVKGKSSSDLSWERGKEPVDVRALVGTINAEYGGWVVIRSSNGQSPAFPKGVVPVVEVEFPPQKPKAAPVKITYSLEEFC